MNLEPLDGYGPWLESLKARIGSAQSRAALAINAELIGLYWQLGREIAERQREQGWGAKVIDRLARDLKDAFPDMKGFSSRNLKYMRTFAERCPDARIGQQPVAQLPWFHVVTLLTRVDDPQAREWYAVQTVQQGWSRNPSVSITLSVSPGACCPSAEISLPPPPTVKSRSGVSAACRIASATSSGA